MLGYTFKIRASAIMQDGGLIGARQSGSQNKRVKFAKLSGTKIICIIIISITYQKAV